MKQLIKKNLIFLPRKARVYFGRVFLYMLGRLGYDEFPLDIPLQMELKKWVELNKAK